MTSTLPSTKPKVPGGWKLLCVGQRLKQGDMKRAMDAPHKWIETMFPEGTYISNLLIRINGQYIRRIKPKKP